MGAFHLSKPYLSALFVTLLFFAPVRARAAEQWYLEFREPGLEESQIRRAVALELRELTIPGDPRRAQDDQDHLSLHIRIAREGGRLYVSLWDRGEFVGRRRVSDSTHSRVLARRVGLAVGELGRRLKAKRVRSARALVRDEELARQEAEQERALNRRKALRLRSGLGSILIPQGGFFVGPSIGVAFNDHHPLSFTTEVSWMVGSVPALSEGTLGGTAPTWSQFEFTLGADYLFETGSLTQLSLGGMLSASALHLSGAAEVEGVSGQRDTWSARMGLRMGTSRKISDVIRARIDLSAGTLLRRTLISYGTKEVSVGGAFLGLSLSASLLPSLSP